MGRALVLVICCPGGLYDHLEIISDIHYRDRLPLSSLQATATRGEAHQDHLAAGWFAI